MKLKPLGAKVVLYPLKQSEQGKHGLYLPGAGKRKESQGVVVAIGPDCMEGLRLGDHVIFNPYSGDKVALRSGGEFFVIPEHKLVAVMTDSGVVVVDTETVQRLIAERLGELLSRYPEEDHKTITEICESLSDRIDNLTIAEGFEW